MPKTNLRTQEFLNYLHSNGNMEKLGTNHDNKTEAIHRWFSFLPGFSHVFVENTLRFFNIENADRLVFDPFMGSATTAVVGKKMGIKVAGNETHKLLYQIGKAKCSRVNNIESIDKIKTEVIKKAKEKWKKNKTNKENPLLRKCFSSNNLKKLVTLRDIYFSDTIPQAYKSLFFAAISALLPRCSNVGISIPYVSWSHTRIAQEPFKQFNLHIEHIKEDISSNTQKTKKDKVDIYLHDSRIKNNHIKNSTVDLIFTSPPYLNNFDYGEALKVYTYFWGITRNWGDITKRIRKKSVTAATTHYKESEFFNKNPENILGEEIIKRLPNISKKIIDKVKLIRRAKNKKNREKSFDILTALYFKDMYHVIKEMYRVLKKGSLSFIIIGDSAPYGIYVPTDKILGQIAIESGFSNYTLETLRPRGYKWLNLTHRHKKRLRESLLILEK